MADTAIKTYDFLVIGGGSGGVRAARVAGSHGASVCLVEGRFEHGPPHYSAMGGTCVNVGCVPKKLMVYGSHYSHYHKEAREFGWVAPENEPPMSFDWAKFMAKKNAEITRLNRAYGRILGNAKVESVEGVATFTDAHTVSVELAAGGTRVISGKNICVAVGGWPFKPDIPGIEHAITSNEIFYLKEQPKRVVVVGGGYIAVEFAAILHGLGSSVQLWYRGNLFLKGFDEDLRHHLATEYGNAGIDVRFNTDASSITKNADGTFNITDKNGLTQEVDCVLYATGRKAKIANLGLETTGVTVDRRGFIPVDHMSKTNLDHFYAVGDVTDRMALTPVALHEGHCLADTLFGGNPRDPDHHLISSAVFSQPEIATIGYTEEVAAQKFGDITVFRSTFTPMLYQMTGTKTKALMKLIVEDSTNKVVGVHMCTPNAGEMMQGVAIAVKMGATKADFDATIGIHPTSAEELVTMRTPSYSYKNGVKVEPAANM